MKKIDTRNVLRNSMKIREVGVIVPLVAAFIFFALNSKVFLTAPNMMNVFRNASFVYITAIGMTFLIISGAFDLSVGSVYAFAGVFAGTLMTNGVPVAVAIIIATALSGALFGGINGFFVQRIGLPPLLARWGQ